MKKKIPVYVAFIILSIFLVLSGHIFQKKNVSPITGFQMDSKFSSDNLYYQTTNTYIESKSYKECETCEAPNLNKLFESGCDSDFIALRSCWWARSFCCYKDPLPGERSVCSELQVKYLREDVIARASYRKNINKNSISYRHGGDRLDSWILKLIGDVSPPCLIIDVGANLGKNTLAYLKNNNVCEIHAFEPIPDTYKMLMNNLRKDTAASFALKSRRINVHRMGVAERSELIQVQHSIGKSGSGSLLKKGSGKFSIEVNVTTISEYFKHHIGSIAFIKIDAEGLDLKVIRGMENFLTTKKVISFIWERHGSIFLHGDIGLAQAEVKYVSSFGYNVYIAGSEEGNLKTLRVDGKHWRRFYEIQGKGVWLAGVVDFFAIIANHPFEKVIKETLISPRCLDVP